MGPGAVPRRDRGAAKGPARKSRKKSGRTGRTRTARSRSQGSAENLTQRVSGPRHDVKHYRFTVIMDTRWLPKLLKNLLARNHHTVLDLSVEAVDHDEADPHYYGTDPVMAVTITGELLLLTDWERGTWLRDPKTGKGGWSKEFPPIMPEQVLQELRAGDPLALREEDKARLPRAASARSGRPRVIP